MYLYGCYYTCFGQPACAFAASRAVSSRQHGYPAEAAGFGHCWLQVAEGAVRVRAAPGTGFTILQLRLSTALMAVG